MRVIWMKLVGLAFAVAGFVATNSLVTASVVIASEESALADEGTFDVVAKLVDIPSKFPPDDLYDYAYVMKYEVIGGPRDKQTIFVAHYKPRLARNKIADKMKPHVSGKVRSFSVGDVHKLTLSPDLKKVWKGPVEDKFAATDSKSVRYWCLVADPG
jgi:hypothetical protein